MKSDLITYKPELNVNSYERFELISNLGKWCAFRAVVAATLLLSFSTNANAWFFFILPGSVVNKITDSITGSEGENCVSEQAKIGDRINVGGKLMVVKSLSGTSVRCTNSALPIRALLELSTDAVAQPTSQAKMDLSEGWESKPITDAAKANGTILLAANKTIDSWIQLDTVKRSSITDLWAFLNTTKANQANTLKELQFSDVVRLNINGATAWRYEVSGRLKSNNAMWTLSRTIFEGKEEIVVVSTWASSTNFAQVKDVLIKIVDSTNGLVPSESKVVSSATSSPPASASQTATPIVAPASEHANEAKGGGISNQQPNSILQSTNSGNQSVGFLQSPKDAAQRLRDLNALLKEGLISESDYENKKKSILEGM